MPKPAPVWSRPTLNKFFFKRPARLRRCARPQQQVTVTVRPVAGPAPGWAVTVTVGPAPASLLKHLR